MDGAVPMETGGPAAVSPATDPAAAKPESAPAPAPATSPDQPQPSAAKSAQPEAAKPASKTDADEAKAVVKGAKKQKVAPEDFNTLPADQWPVRPYLEKYVAPLLMQAMQEVVNERPEKPLVFLAEWLLKADKAGGGPGTPGKAEKAAAVSPKADAAKLVAVDQASAAPEATAPQSAQPAATQ